MDNSFLPKSKNTKTYAAVDSCFPVPNPKIESSIYC